MNDNLFKRKDFTGIRTFLKNRKKSVHCCIILTEFWHPVPHHTTTYFSRFFCIFVVGGYLFPWVNCLERRKHDYFLKISIFFRIVLGSQNTLVKSSRFLYTSYPHICSTLFTMDIFPPNLVSLLQLILHIFATKGLVIVLYILWVWTDL